MKARSSVNKANWSATREGQYLEDCNKILFDKKLELSIIEDDVYLISQDDKTLLLKIDKPKSMWYQIWLKLKSI